MNKKTKTNLRIVSIVVTILDVLMVLEIMPNFFIYNFWVMIIAYFLLVLSIR